MCLSENGDSNVSKEFFHTDDVKDILERQWSRKKSYVMMWKQKGNSHILVTC